MRIPLENISAICVVDEDPATYESLTGHFPSVRWYRDARTFLAEMDAWLPDAVVVADTRAASAEGTELIRALRDRGIATPVILLCGDADVATAVRAIRSGAADFIEKPLHSALLVSAIRRLCRQLPAAAP
jgi:two-component system C4-dicarboxylate transport response regulator DctD